MQKKVLLMILDGWGIASNRDVSAIDRARTPFIDMLYKKYPRATLRTDGHHVGLPDGQMGNSEVGHMNLGAGRIVYQDLAKINLAVESKTLRTEKVLVDAFKNAKENGRDIHFLGLLSDGGVHSHIDHLLSLLDTANTFGLKNAFVHAFTDGRDVDPKSGIHFLRDLERHLEKTGGTLATVTGRYYAMDRDKRWERIKLAYDALVHSIGTPSTDIIESIQKNYDNHITDEFIKPIIMTDNAGKPVARIKEGDVVIFFNFRTDRGRELTDALSQNNYPEQDMQKLNVHYVTLTNYDETFRNINVIFDKEHLADTLGEVLERHHKTQIRIAETEKYPHVTFFFSGGREMPFEGETRILRNSPKVATYDLKPEMSAYKLRDALIPELQKGTADFICLNLANGDMVGHTGVMEAAIKACEAVDTCVEDIVTTALKNTYTTLLIADHGNCETMMNADGTPHTSHTTNPVPIILIDTEIGAIKNGILGDVAPTILKLMGVEQPETMTRHPLI